MDMIIRNISLVATPEGKKAVHGEKMKTLHCRKDTSIIIENGKIAFLGPEKEAFRYCKDQNKTGDDYKILEGKGKCALPGFIDSHTHFIFGGYRPEEFMMRLAGKEYLEIHRMGGGIEATVQATRSASEEELFYQGEKRLTRMLKQGVTCVEGKSGYGLNLSTEIRQLQVIRRLQREQPVEVVPTFLGAHAIGKEFAGDGDAYISYLIQEVLPEVVQGGLAEYCDAFIEEGVFTASQGERLFKAAREAGMGIKVHADEMNSIGAVEAGLKYGAVSADHLLKITEQDIQKLGKTDTVATLLPATAFCLHKPYAPARKLIDGGCAVALASDFNPGSCFSDNIPLMIALSVIHMGMSLEEAVTALTINGAAALGRAGRIGSLETGKDADIVLLGCPDYKYLVYYTAENLVDTVIKKGKVVMVNDYEI